MSLQNIGASNRDDAFYRYKMPKLITKIEGRGNGIKTNLVNMVDVAKALARSPSYTTKYFGYELGAQSKFDKKTGTSIVNGAHETSKLANLLEIFIKKYVQCYGCGNPETEIVITKSQTITLKCAACGHVSIVDMRDKITGFILKNPPQHKIKGLPKDDKSLRRAERERLKEGLAADHEEKKKLKRSDHLQAMKKKCALSNEEPKKFFKKNGQNSEYGHGKIYKNGGEQAKGCDEDEDGVQWQTDTSIAAAKQRMKEQLNSVTSEMVILSGFNDGHDCKHSNKVTQKQFSSGSDCEEGKTETLKKHTNGVSKILSENEVGQDGSQSRQANVIANASLELLEQGMDDEDDGIDSKDGRNTVFKNHANYMASKLIEENKENLQEKLVEAYFVALFGGVSKELSKEIEKEKGFLVKVVQNVESQRLLLRVLESYCSKNQGIGRHIALVLKVLYDGDILEEEQILEWYDQVGYHKNASRVRKDAFPFVQWLREAETEDEE